MSDQGNLRIISFIFSNTAQELVISRAGLKPCIYTYVSTIQVFTLRPSKIKINLATFQL